MREVEDSPNRCPECQRVQLDTSLCFECATKGLATYVETECFIRSSRDQDLLDILDILAELCYQLSFAGTPTATSKAEQMIASMRESVSQRRAG